MKVTYGTFPIDPHPPRSTSHPQHRRGVLRALSRFHRRPTRRCFRCHKDLDSTQVGPHYRMPAECAPAPARYEPPQLELFYFVPAFREVT